MPTVDSIRSRMRTTRLPVLAVELLGVLVVEHHVEALEAVGAPIGDDVAGLERVVVGSMGQPMAHATALDTADLVGDLHTATVVFSG